MATVREAIAVGLSLLPQVATLAAEPPPLMLASVCDCAALDLSEYWISEKYDGIRAYWNGRELLTRNGHRIRAPAWFTHAWPREPLDGELWIGRGRFEALSSIVRDANPDETAWRQVRFMVFDLPAHPGSFTQRLNRLQMLLSSEAMSLQPERTLQRDSTASAPPGSTTPPSDGTAPSPPQASEISSSSRGATRRREWPPTWLRPAPQFRLTDHDALAAKLDQVVAGGGEGLMLHRADARYRLDRSEDLLKLKPHQDAEARVTAHLPGNGKYQGMLGALEVQRPDGLRFRIGTGFTDDERRHPPPLGAWITYSYYGLTAKGVPRFARFLRVRKDETPDATTAAQAR